MDPLLVLIATLGAAGITGLVAYLVAKRGTSGGVKETAADRLWSASEKMRAELTERDIATQKVLVAVRQEVVDTRVEVVALRTQIVSLEAEIRELHRRLDNAGSEEQRGEA